MVVAGVSSRPCTSSFTLLASQQLSYVTTLCSLGWTNTATLGTILCYVFYWLTVIGILVCASLSPPIPPLFSHPSVPSSSSS